MGCSQRALKPVRTQVFECTIKNSMKKHEKLIKTTSLSSIKTHSSWLEVGRVRLQQQLLLRDLSHDLPAEVVRHKSELHGWPGFHPALAEIPTVGETVHVDGLVARELGLDRTKRSNRSLIADCSNIFKSANLFHDLEGLLRRFPDVDHQRLVQLLGQLQLLLEGEDLLPFGRILLPSFPFMVPWMCFKKRNRMMFTLKESLLLTFPGREAACESPARTLPAPPPSLRPLRRLFAAPRLRPRRRGWPAADGSRRRRGRGGREATL